MLIPSLLVICGFIMLGAGAEFMVAGSSRLAIRIGISPLIVGLTIVAFGTSAPELAVSIKSTTEDYSALGNVIGSNIANIGLVLGITALISPIRIEKQLVRTQIPVVIVASVFMGVLLLDGELNLTDGAMLSIALLIYLYANFRQADKEFERDELDIHPTLAAKEAGQTSFNFILIISGLALLVFGSQVFVDNAVTLARVIGFSEALIGLTLIAIGTSIPELATSIVAATRRQSDIAVGNIVGSNVFNILCVLGITALISPIAGNQFSTTDFAVMILFSSILLPLAWTNLTLSRTEGMFLLAGYVVYLVFVTQQA
ncbi:MAG: calcium/sodium antiporter [Pseudomonadales bacterium]|nr:calcium/sodium antiporter [Pseudomonadales bacterium]